MTTDSRQYKSVNGKCLRKKLFLGPYQFVNVNFSKGGTTHFFTFILPICNVKGSEHELALVQTPSTTKIDL